MSETRCPCGASLGVNGVCPNYGTLKSGDPPGVTYTSAELATIVEASVLVERRAVVDFIRRRYSKIPTEKQSASSYWTVQDLTDGIEKGIHRG